MNNPKSSEVAKHNVLHGHTESIRRRAELIGTRPSVSEETTQICGRIIELCDELRKSLKHRADQS